MTEVQKARIIVKIDQLEREKVNKERKLAVLRGDFEFAWHTHGSELAGFDDKGLGDKILELSIKTTYLRDCLRDNVDPKSCIDSLRNRIDHFNSELETANILKKTEEETLKMMTFVLAVCEGKE